MEDFKVQIIEDWEHYKPYVQAGESVIFESRHLGEIFVVSGPSVKHNPPHPPKETYYIEDGDCRSYSIKAEHCIILNKEFQ